MRKRIIDKSKLKALKKKILKYKGAIAAGAGVGLAGAVLGAGYGASVILNKLRDPKDVANLREAIFGISNPFKYGKIIDMENIGSNKYRIKEI